MFPTKTQQEVRDKSGDFPSAFVTVPQASRGHSSSDEGSQSADPIHVLFIIDELCGIGGAEKSLLNIIRLLPKDRFRCTVITFKVDMRWSAFDNFPCPWMVYSLTRTYDWNAVRLALRLRRFIREQNVRIVQTFFVGSDLWGGLVAKLSGVPLLISSRRDMGILRNSKHELAYRLLNPLYDAVLAVSDSVRDFCIRHDRLPPERVLTLHNGVEIERIPTNVEVAIWRASSGLANASHVISTVGHIRRVKGQDVLIRAAKKVCEEHPRAVFLVIGGVLESDYMQELFALTQSLGLQNNVKFLGDSHEVIRFLELSDMFCLASRSEGFSNALLEAMAASLPCVATRVGGTAEALEEGRSGFLVEPEDSNSLAERLLCLMRQPDRAKKMGHAGRQIVEAKFALPVMMSRLIKLYETAG